MTTSLKMNKTDRIEMITTALHYLVLSRYDRANTTVLIEISKILFEQKLVMI